MVETRVGDTRWLLQKGDITRARADAIVNAANSTLLGGGGVDGAIHRAGGPSILEECRRIAERDGRCPTGSAVVTGAGNLPARWVIHAVGPVWSGGERREDELLASAYRTSLELARDAGARSIAFPSISTGAYRFPIDRAARIALGTVREYISAGGHGLEEVRFVLFSDADLEAYAAALRELDA